MTKVRLLTIAGVALLSASTVPYSLAQTNSATFNVIYDFGNSSSTSNPYGGLAQSRAGYLYGRTDPQLSGGGAPDTAYRITPAGQITVLPVTVGGLDISNAGFTLMPDGLFYSAGFDENGLGTIFKTTAEGDVTTLHTFDELAEVFLPTLGIDGNLYGTYAYNSSIVYRLTPSGTFTVLHPFETTEGDGPGPLIQGTDGYFYGVATRGGNNDNGTIFKMDYLGNLTVLFRFDGSNGSYPIGPLVQGSDGDFYGSTSGLSSGGTGVIFKVTPHGVFQVLHYSNSSDYLGDALVQATDGNFYGITQVSTTGCGTLFRMTPTGVYDTLYTFGLQSDAPDGCFPTYGLLQHTNGILYGTTEWCGTPPTYCEGQADGYGVVFSLDVGLSPFVAFLPAASRPGQTVGIFGQGFVGATAVDFDGTPAQFTVLSDTYLTAPVPAGAGTGFITVTTPSGTLTSNKKFQVRPVITSFSPSSGPVGTMVVIKGVSLGQTSKVTFDEARALSFTVDSDTQVTAFVPTSAVTGKIGITTTGAPSYSRTNFTLRP